jgi:hypothetical protein
MKRKTLLSILLLLSIGFVQATITTTQGTNELPPVLPEEEFTFSLTLLDIYEGEEHTIEELHVHYDSAFTLIKNSDRSDTTTTYNFLPPSGELQNEFSFTGTPLIKEGGITTYSVTLKAPKDPGIYSFFAKGTTNKQQTFQTFITQEVATNLYERENKQEQNLLTKGTTKVIEGLTTPTEATKDLATTLGKLTPKTRVSTLSNSKTPRDTMTGIILVLLTAIVLGGVAYFVNKYVLKHK